MINAKLLEERPEAWRFEHAEAGPETSLRLDAIDSAKAAPSFPEGARSSWRGAITLDRAVTPILVFDHETRWAAKPDADSLLGCMTPRALSTVSIIAWLTLLLCLVVFFFIAISAPATALVRNARDRDERIRSVESSTDLRQVQGTAIGLLQAGYATSDAAMILCRIVLGALLFIIIGTVITLRQIRRIRRDT